jgi:alkyldihydroxyacetonephosphate synthase
VILLGQVADDATAQENLKSIWETAMQTCLERNVSLSHHHGIGLARSPYIQEALGSSLVVLERVKKALDPNSILNPGKLGLS